MKGFSPRNLKYMRAFAKAYSEESFVQQVAAQIPFLKSYQPVKFEDKNNA
jgi:hypothetical protein